MSIDEWVFVSMCAEGAESSLAGTLCMRIYNRCSLERRAMNFVWLDSTVTVSMVHAALRKPTSPLKGRGLFARLVLADGTLMGEGVILWPRPVYQ